MPNLFGVEVSAEVYELNRHLAATKEPKSDTRRDLDAELKKQNAAKFEALWSLLGGPPLEKEYKFCPDRDWRADYRTGSWLIELEGGVWSGGRHTRGKGFINDCFKYNTAAMMGYRVIRLATGMANPEYLQQIIESITWEGLCSQKFVRFLGAAGAVVRYCTRTGSTRSVANERCNHLSVGGNDYPVLVAAPQQSGR